jgi:hypothetical protein
VSVGDGEGDLRESGEMEGVGEMEGGVRWRGWGVGGCGEVWRGMRGEREAGLGYVLTELHSVTMASFAPWMCLSTSPW